MRTPREANVLEMTGVPVARRGGALNVHRRAARRTAATQTKIFGSPSGFTLLEVLVSLSIVAIAITVMLQLFSMGLRLVAVSEENVTAVVKAEAKMREVLDRDDLAETSWSEATPDGYRMDVSIIDTLKERTNNLQVRVMQVSLTTRWFKGNKEKTLTLRTLKTISKVASASSPSGGSAPKTSTGATTPTASTPGTTTPRMSQ